MNVIDSSCWLEYFAGSNTGDRIAMAVEDIQRLIVPTIVLYEVFKKLLVELDEDSALLAIAHMKQGEVITLTPELAIYSAHIGKEFKLPMADSIIYATSRKFNAVLWTQDQHFETLDFVQYFPKVKNQ
jgi:predicted nucleic acid-binding protein